MAMLTTQDSMFNPSVALDNLHLQLTVMTNVNIWTTIT